MRSVCASRGSIVSVAFTAAFLFTPMHPPAQARPKTVTELKADSPLATKLAAVRASHKVPAAWGAILQGNRIVSIAAVGVRKDGSDQAATINDRIHLGSDTKAMTATVIASLVEKKKLRWDSTIGQVLPEFKGKIHADYLNVTVTQLLAHEGGVMPDIDWWSGPKGKSTREQRTALLPVILKDAPANKPGTKFSYSNASFVVAGAMAEAAADASWEDLMTDTLFKPLGMASAGFGAPGTKDGLDEPWGHKRVSGKNEPSQGDNAPVLGPAGTVHASIADWGKFASFHMLGAQQGKQRSSFAHLHTPAKGFTYAGGWFSDGTQLSHDGSNTMWYARVRIYPKQNVAYLSAVNVGGDEGHKAVDEIEKVLEDHYRRRK